MDILIIDPQFEDVFGGAREVSYTIAEILDKEGHDVTLLHGSSRDKEEFEEFYDLDLSSLDYRKKREPFLSKLLDLTGRFHLLSRMIRDYSFTKYAKDRESEFDLIIFGRHIYDAEIDFEKPVMQYVHAPMKETTFENPKLYRKLYRYFAVPRLNSSADITLYNSEHTKSLNEVDGEVVYPPVDEKLEPEREKKDQAVIVGRISPEKNVKESVEILSNTDLNVVVIGSVFDEDYLQKVKDSADQSVNIRTNIPRDELREILEDSKIGISFNETEGFGMNVVEYMKAGAVPLAYNAAGPKEILKNEDLLFSDIQEAQDKLDDVLSNFEEYQEETLERSENFGKSVFRSEILQRVDKLVNRQ